VRIPFKVSARTARLIGRENVANAEAAIIELVKNSYDADAEYCYVAINPIKDELYIIDNGTGMTSTTIEKHWMVIGTENKLHNFTSEQGRVQSGAKGIGRFALDRLGHKCTLLSTSSNSKSIKWNVNWDVFDEKSTKTIDNVKADLDDYKFSLNDEVDKILGEVTPEFKLDTGVIISIHQLRDSWDEKRIKELYTNLEALIPPKEETFKLYVYDLTNLDKFGEVLPALCDDYDFKLDALIKGKNAKITIYRNEYLIDELPSEFFKGKKEPYDLATFKKGFYTKKISTNTLLPGFEDKHDMLSEVGDFSLSLYFMKLGSSSKDREKYFYKSFDKKRRTEWLGAFGGIKIFRDNFRVRPYGESNSGSWDWLQLGGRQAASPAQVSRHKQYRARPQNIAGSVHISRLTNIAFDDKSSREGLQDSDEFKLFRNLILSVLKYLEDDRSYIASELSRIHKKNNVTESVRAEAEKKSKQITKSLGGKSDDEYTVEEMLAVSVEAQKEEIISLLEEQRLMRVFASIGLTISSFAHELSSIDRKLVSRFDDIEELFLPFAPIEDMKKVKDFLNPYILLEENKKEDKKIKQWLNYTLESIRKDKRKRRNVNLCDYFELYKESWAFTLGERHVNLDIKDSDTDCSRAIVRAFEIDLDTMFNNLLMNSLDAFYRKKEPHINSKRNITISIVNHDKHVGIRYCDNGPGLSNDIINQDDIFAPLFTTKKDRHGADKGTGLGMWLVKNVADEYSAEVSLKKSKGFCVEISIPLRKERWNV